MKLNKKQKDRIAKFWERETKKLGSDCLFRIVDERQESYTSDNTYLYIDGAIYDVLEYGACPSIATRYDELLEKMGFTDSPHYASVRGFGEL